MAELGREYTLSDIAVITARGRARLLGLRLMCCHLGTGADGDVTIYAPDDDKRRMFALPRYVFKAGTVVVDDGEPRASMRAGGRCPSAPSTTGAIVPELEAKARAGDSSIELANFGVPLDDVANPSILTRSG